MANAPIINRIDIVNVNSIVALHASNLVGRLLKNDNIQRVDVMIGDERAFLVRKGQRVSKAEILAKLIAAPNDNREIVLAYKKGKNSPVFVEKYNRIELAAAAA